MKDAHVVRDAWSGMDLPIYYAEFSCVEHARHTHDTAASAPASNAGACVEKGGGFIIDGAKVSIRFAAATEPPASSEKALKVFQDGQSAARLATLESDEVTQASRERSEANAQVRMLGVGVAFYKRFEKNVGHVKPSFSIARAGR